MIKPDVTVLTISIAILLLEFPYFPWIVWRCRSQLRIQIRKGSPEQKSAITFSDWASALTPIGTALELILPVIQRNPATTGLSLLFGATTLLIPFAYKTFFAPTERVWHFLVGSSVMLLVIQAQLFTAAALADDFILPDIPNQILYPFRMLMIGAALLGIIYTCRSTKDLNKPQTMPEQQPTSEISVLSETFVAGR